MAAEPVAASVFIEAAPERVYQYFVRPEAMVRWLGDHAELEPEPGGRFAVDVLGRAIRGCYLELDPPNRLLISWGYAGSERLPPGTSTVEVRLTAEGEGTRVELEHRDLPDEDVPDHVSGWGHYLPRLELAAAGGDPGTDLGMPSPA